MAADASLDSRTMRIPETRQCIPKGNAMHEAKSTTSILDPRAEKCLSSPTKPAMDQTPLSPVDAESYLNSIRSSRTASIYSLSRISLSSQLSQLTALSLPNIPALSTSISSIPTASVAATTLKKAAEQISIWLEKAKEVLNGLDAEDDVEWAAAGGREGLGEVDIAVGKFEELISAYVTAIESLQARSDISGVPAEHLKAVVSQMERVLREWDGVRRSLRNVKAQVELALEWEELWNSVLGDIGLEIENLSRLVFEMEEARHKAIPSDTLLDGTGVLDVQELETIVEEGERGNAYQRSDLYSNTYLGPDSPISPGLSLAAEDTRLLALFARLQPLCASLNFLPMTLSNFRTRAELTLPTACQELESRRVSLLKKYKVLESDAEGLRKELGEDRWVVVFRNAGRKALKMCESVERTVNKLQELIDTGIQHSNRPLLDRKVSEYEAKKSHLGTSIEKMLGIIAKGATGRLTVNGEILRLQMDTKSRWRDLKQDMKDLDLALDDLSKNKNQQLRDSISTIVSMDRATDAGSAADTPGSSPVSLASSGVVGLPSGGKRDPSPGMGISSRRSSVGYISTIRSTSSRRNVTMPSNISTQLPRKAPLPRSISQDVGSRGASPSPYSKHASTTPTPGSRSQRPSLSIDNKPRWNSSPKVDYFEFGTKPKPLPYSNPPLGRSTSMAFRSPTSMASYTSSHLPLSSPLGRSSPIASPASISGNNHSRSVSNQPMQKPRKSSLSTTPKSTDWVKVKEKTSASPNLPKRQSIGLESNGDTTAEDSPLARPRTQRPSTSMAGSRRISMLPLPKGTSPTSISGPRMAGDSYGRQTPVARRPASSGKDSSMAMRPRS